MTKLAETLADNISALMRDRQITSDAAFAKLAKVDQKTIWRIRHREQSPTIDKLETIAQEFGLHAWQLLIPNLDPRNPPVFVMTDTERDLYQRLANVAHDVAAQPPLKKYQ
jgi:transcriptional regulator with XRE-family HTH domain